MSSVLKTLDDEGIAVVDDFIAPHECALILSELRFTYWGDSTVVESIGEETSPAYLSAMRSSQTSGQVWFGDELNDTIARIENRLVDLLACSRTHLEEWQATRYGQGDRFDYHVDGGNWERTAAGERKRSIIVYLDTPRCGGDTHFRALIEPSRLARAGC